MVQQLHNFVTTVFNAITTAYIVVITEYNVVTTAYYDDHQHKAVTAFHSFSLFFVNPDMV